jgi:hypothetical protein
MIHAVFTVNGEMKGFEEFVRREEACLQRGGTKKKGVERKKE